MNIEQENVRLITPGIIAEKLKVPLHRVLYILSTRQHIKPAARAGTLRLYSNKSIALVRHELNAISARKGGNHVAL